MKHLRSLRQASLDEYVADENVQAIVERRLQLSIQACMDIATYLIAQLGFSAPDAPENVFAVLGGEGVLGNGRF